MIFISSQIAANRNHPLSGTYIPEKQEQAERVKAQLPIIWVLGGPGSGKGTQCEKIVLKYEFTHLSTGDLLRAEVASGSDRGKNLTAIMERGELVSNEIVLELLKEAIETNSATSKGFLIDGYPREKEQGAMFEKIVGPVDLIIFFDAPEEVLVERLLGRAQTSGRADDNEETIKLRLHTFKNNNDKVVQQYTNKLVTINAIGSVDEIFRQVETNIDALLKSKQK